MIRLQTGRPRHRTHDRSAIQCWKVVVTPPGGVGSGMHRLALAGALLASACGSATDDRPPTLDFITETILAPSCATAQCHSAFAREVGDEFDTPAAARRSIVANSLATPNDQD